MLEKAVNTVLGESISGSSSLSELAIKLRQYIEPLMSKIQGGKKVPFDDFSRFA